MARIQAGHFVRTARRSATFAVVRNAIFVLVLGWSMHLYLTPAPEGRARPMPTSVALAVEGPLALLAAWRLTVAVRRRAQPWRHPRLQAFAPFGEPLEVAAALEREVERGEAVVIGDVLLGARLLVKTGAPYSVVALNQLAWVYAKTTRHSVNFIPVGSTTTYEVFGTSRGQRFVPLSLTADVKLYEELKARAPQARFGWSVENEEWWHRERLALVAQDAKSRTLSADGP